MSGSRSGGLGCWDPTIGVWGQHPFSKGGEGRKRGGCSTRWAGRVAGSPGLGKKPGIWWVSAVVGWLGALGGRIGWEWGWLRTPGQENKTPLAPLTTVRRNFCSYTLKDQAQSGLGTPLALAAAPQASPPWVSSWGRGHGSRSGTAWGTRGTGPWVRSKPPSACERRAQGGSGLSWDGARAGRGRQGCAGKDSLPWHFGEGAAAVLVM